MWCTLYVNVIITVLHSNRSINFNNAIDYDSSNSAKRRVIGFDILFLSLWVYHYSTVNAVMVNGYLNN